MQTWQHLVLYDGTCTLCSRTVQWLIAKDKKQLLHFAAQQSDLGKQLLNQHLHTANPQTLVFLSQGKWYTQSTAVLAIAALLPRPYQWLRIARFIPAFLRDFIYKIIAANRYKWFGKTGACWLPSPTQQQRILG